MAHRKAHAVVPGQQAVARAVAPVHETLGLLHFLQISDEHRRFSWQFIEDVAMIHFHRSQHLAIEMAGIFK
ncbi:hypothetical protein [Rhizobium ruizarguesonis]|uniref:hypothetical protein n=1 Tax=Rhizobium ruizarguesonis TaxID=2081791 RepID=UPI001FE1021D|nr:hypothetical protein [Rhizobium ruizarguesonis]